MIWLIVPVWDCGTYSKANNADLNNRQHNNMVSRHPAQTNNSLIEDSDIFAIRGNCNHSGEDHLKRICSTCNDENDQQEVGHISINMFGYISINL